MLRTRAGDCAATVVARATQTPKAVQNRKTEPMADRISGLRPAIVSPHGRVDVSRCGADGDGVQVPPRAQRAPCALRLWALSRPERAASSKLGGVSGPSGLD